MSFLKNLMSKLTGKGRISVSVKGTPRYVMTEDIVKDAVVSSGVLKETVLKVFQVGSTWTLDEVVRDDIGTGPIQFTSGLGTGEHAGKRVLTFAIPGAEFAGSVDPVYPMVDVYCPHDSTLASGFTTAAGGVNQVILRKTDDSFFGVVYIVRIAYIQTN